MKNIGSFVCLNTISRYKAESIISKKRHNRMNILLSLFFKTFFYIIKVRDYDWKFICKEVLAMLEKFKAFNKQGKIYTVQQRISRLKRHVYGLLIALGVLIIGFITVFIIEFDRVSNYYYNEIAETRITNTGTERKNFINLYFSMAFQDLHDSHKELSYIDISDGAGNVDITKLKNSLNDPEIMPYFLENVGVICDDTAYLQNDVQFTIPKLSINSSMLLTGKDLNLDSDENLYFIYPKDDHELNGIDGHIGYVSKKVFTDKISTTIYNEESSTLILKKNGDFICISSLIHDWRFFNFFGTCFTNLNDAMKVWVNESDYNRYIEYMDNPETIIFNAGQDDRDGMFYKYELNVGDEDSTYYLIFMAPRGLLTNHAIHLTTICLVAFYSSVFIGTIGIYTLAILLVMDYNKRKREEAFYKETGLYKEDAFFHDTQAILLQNPLSKFGLIYINIQNFSRINSYFGTIAGDKILDEVGKILSNSIEENPYEIAGYQHGDKYMLLLKGDIDDVLFKLQDFNEKLTSYNYDYGQKLVFSFGIKITDAQYALDLRGEFDCAKYSESKSGKTEIFNNYDQEMIARQKETEDINGRFEEALQNEEFEVFLQLKWSLKDNDWAGAEALCRWRDPIKGLISPGKFIPLFEENGKIVKLDAYMFENTCKILRHMLDEGERCVPVSFNLSKRNFQDLSFIEKYHEIIEKYQIPHELIEVEITEGLLVDNIDTFTSFIKIFHENDFSISMDDFGAGYSSLNMIHELDFDVIKIDARFFRGGFDETNQIIVSSIINLCHQLNKIVVAEGVENTNEVEFLKSAGCDIVQGYYFAKPLPVDDFKNLLFNKPENK